MRVGVFSDTHDHLVAIDRALRAFADERVAAVVHAGDLCAPFALKFIVQRLATLKLPLYAVFGNNDGERVGLAGAFKDRGTLLPGPREFTFGGRRFLLMHEDGCVSAAAQSEAVDIIVYGHTHDVDVRQGPPLVINPGEAGGWLRGRSTIGIVDLASLDVEIIDL